MFYKKKVNDKQTTFTIVVDEDEKESLKQIRKLLSQMEDSDKLIAKYR